MKVPEFAATCEALGLRSLNNFYYGVIGEWPLKVSFVTGNICLSAAVDQPKNKQALSALKKAIKGWGSVAVSAEGLGLTLRLKRFKGTAAECVLAAADALGSSGYKPSTLCPLCKKAGCNAAALYRIQFRPVHRSCLSEAASKAEDKASVAQEKGSYLLGIIGAILGMLVGTLPTLLTIISMGMEYAMLFALIPICAYFGYKFLGGKMNRSAIIVTIIMAIVGVYILTFEYATYLDITEYGYAASDAFRLFFGYITYLPNWVSLIGSLITEFIFAAIGVFLSWRIITRTPADTAVEAKAVLELAIPYPVQDAGFSPDFSAEDETV